MFDPIFEHMDFGDTSSIGDMLGDFDLSTADENIINTDVPTEQSQADTDSIPVPTEQQTPMEEFPTFDLGDLDIGSDINLALTEGNDVDEDEFFNLDNEQNVQNADEELVIEGVDTKLELARVYMGLDPDMARGMLEEVINGGNQAQKTEAQELLKQLG
jgi:pilus assembly protein FimV